MKDDKYVKVCELNSKVAASTSEILAKSIEFMSLSYVNYELYGKINCHFEDIKKYCEKSEEKIISLIKNKKLHTRELSILLVFLEKNDIFFNIAKKCLRITKHKKKNTVGIHSENVLNIAGRLFGVFNYFVHKYTDNCNIISASDSLDSFEELSYPELAVEIEKLQNNENIDAVSEDLINISEYISFLIKHKSYKI